MNKLLTPHSSLLTKRWHSWFIAMAILTAAAGALTLWGLLLPLPEAHGAYSISKSARFNDDKIKLGL